MLSFVNESPVLKRKARKRNSNQEKNDEQYLDNHLKDVCGYLNKIVILS